MPFLLLTVPYIKMADKTIKETAADVAGHPDLEEANDYIMRNSFKCKGFAYDNGTDTKSQVFMSKCCSHKYNLCVYSCFRS